ncbi:SphA family protein [Paracoccus litorisediminis]|jgi:hypothetical protein|nr:transporter [Paracoccus litorisediminis]
MHDTLENLSIGGRTVRSAEARSSLLSIGVTAALLTSAAPQAQATEAVAGRYIPGIFAGPGAGVVPPAPGFYWGIQNAYYHGEAGDTVPFGEGRIAIGLEADMWVTALAGVYVPEQNLPGNWTYSFQFALPFGWTGATAELGPIDTDQDVAGLGDIAFAPVALGWHNDAMNMFFSSSLTVTAPTGEWESGDIAFIGLNYWTFTPAIGVTRLIPEQGLDLSAKFGVDINTRNPDTDYYSGAVAHLDLSMTKGVNEQLAVGGLAGFLYQIEDDDDDGGFADNHDGFRGSSIAIGPLLTYKSKLANGNEIDLTFKWAHEIDVDNRMKGDAVFLTIAGKF